MQPRRSVTFRRLSVHTDDAIRSFSQSHYFCHKYQGRECQGRESSANDLIVCFVFIVSSGDSGDYKELFLDIQKPPALCQSDYEACNNDWRKDWCSTR